MANLCMFVCMRERERENEDMCVCIMCAGRYDYEIKRGGN